jgi:DNA-binding response OmpR family regulator
MHYGHISIGRQAALAASSRVDRAERRAYNQEAPRRMDDRFRLPSQRLPGVAMRILVVDDNRDILDLIQRVLQTYGFEVVIARDGLEALQQESSTQPDLVVLDVNLPALDGWEVCRRIKARREVPIMLLTVRAERADLERSHDAGADDHLPKPFDIAEFLNRIDRLVPPTSAPRTAGSPRA